ncbi:hypothetical protein R1sor_011725 [Riccia sorocarpa]|uniref:Uncharacterized protein n=1 Tax=Riccia sorocarpa TaxID=122646 RepID=A0ABD3I549_9MARC
MEHASDSRKRSVTLGHRYADKYFRENSVSDTQNLTFNCVGPALRLSRFAHATEVNDDANESPSWRVSDNPIYSMKLKAKQTDGVPRGLRANGLYRSRSEVGISKRRRKNWKSLLSQDTANGANSKASRRLERSDSAPALGDESNHESRSTKTTLRRYRSRLKESEAFKSSVAPLWEYLSSRMLAFGRSLFSNTSTLSGAIDKSEHLSAANI